MRHPAFTSWSRTLFYLGCFLLSGGVFALSLTRVSPLGIGTLLLNGAFSGLLLSGLTVLLWFVLRFTRLSGYTPLQGLLNHLALLALLLVVWLGTEHLVFYVLVSPEILKQLVDLIPIKVLVGTLFLVLMVRQYSGSTHEIDQSGLESDCCEEETPTLEKKDAVRQPVETVTVKTGSNIHLIPVTDLLYLQAEGDYVLLYTAKTRYIKEETMKHLESQLPPCFVRIHRSYIVNTNTISRLELFEKQHYLITLQSGHQLRASASGYKVLKEKLQL